jgi:hypothetical protein
MSRYPWAGVLIERCAFGPSWLDGIGAILHPAALTKQPRGLLQALAGCVRVYATPESGLDPAGYLPLHDFRGTSTPLSGSISLPPQIVDAPARVR